MKPRGAVTGSRPRVGGGRGLAERLLLVAALVLAASTARADGVGVWDRAADPDAERAERLHRAVDELVVEALERGAHRPSGLERLRVARNMLVAFGAEKSPDVRLRFDLGRVLGMLAEDARAVPVLESALAEAPDAPGANDAWFSLAIGYARQRRPADELAAYGEFLRRETDPGSRARAVANRAESEVLQGKMEAALADFDAALALEPDSVTTRWSHAVALDRAGEPARAIAEARAAISMDPLDLHLADPAVFFVPPYDRLWYEALGATARARPGEPPAEQVRFWSEAVDKWTAYLAAAAADDRWVPIANARRAAAEKALREAKKRAARAPKR